MKNGITRVGFACAGVALLWGAGFGEALDMTAIFERVDSRNPELKAARGEVEAAASEIDQAGLLPNPELEIGTENLGMAEAEVVVSQPLELGGKRKSRMAAAKLGREEAELRLAAVRLGLHAEALRRCGVLVEVKAGIAVIDTMLALALRDKQRVDRRVEAGAAMELDGIRSQVAVDEIRMQREALLERRRTAGRYLAALWHDSSLSSEPAITLWGRLPPIAGDSVAARLSEHPDMKRAALTVRIHEAELVHARAERVPETAVHGGFLRNNESGENAALLGLSVGLPLFNRNQGAVAARARRVEAAKEEYEAARRAMRSETRSLVSRLNTLRRQVATLEDTIIPRLSEVHASLEEYYARGLVSILEVLESRRALVDKELEAVEMRAQWWQGAAELFEKSGVRYSIHSQEY